MSKHLSGEEIAKLNNETLDALVAIGIHIRPAAAESAPIPKAAIRFAHGEIVSGYHTEIGGSPAIIIGRQANTFAPGAKSSTKKIEVLAFEVGSNRQLYLHTWYVRGSVAATMVAAAESAGCRGLEQMRLIELMSH